MSGVAPPDDPAETDFLGIVPLTPLGLDAVAARVAQRPASAPFATVIAIRSNCS